MTLVVAIFTFIALPLAIRVPFGFRGFGWAVYPSHAQERLAFAKGITPSK